MKNNHLLVALSTVGLTLTCGTAFANEDNIPLNDQVRFIGELESRSSDNWNFNTNESTFGEEAYLLQMSQPDVRLIEQDRSRWGNDGDGRNYSILVDVYNSDEE
ncbi:hypothetical protein [Myxosarcina sp. GI1]|uniref:hypothetical protein n=1 Tax=Myxosarcina sp. GI1 TaxID=1541065 RepID=UPI000562FF49|nr:hypothetical protein [Myxosarcina sp. GI1]